MKRRALYTIAMGSDPSFRYTLAAMRFYASKVGAEFISWELSPPPPPPPPPLCCGVPWVAGVNGGRGLDVSANSR